MNAFHQLFPACYQIPHKSKLYNKRMPTPQSQWRLVNLLFLSRLDMNHWFIDGAFVVSKRCLIGQIVHGNLVHRTVSDYLHPATKTNRPTTLCWRAHKIIFSHRVLTLFDLFHCHLWQPNKSRLTCNILQLQSNAFVRRSQPRYTKAWWYRESWMLWNGARGDLWLHVVCGA